MRGGRGELPAQVSLFHSSVHILSVPPSLSVSLLLTFSVPLQCPLTAGFCFLNGPGERGLLLSWVWNMELCLGTGDAQPDSLLRRVTGPLSMILDNPERLLCSGKSPGP